MRLRWHHAAACGAATATPARTVQNVTTSLPSYVPAGAASNSGTAIAPGMELTARSSALRVSSSTRDASCAARRLITSASGASGTCGAARASAKLKIRRERDAGQLERHVPRTWECRARRRRPAAAPCAPRRWPWRRRGASAVSAVPDGVVCTPDCHASMTTAAERRALRGTPHAAPLLAHRRCVQMHEAAVQLVVMHQRRYGRTARATYGVRRRGVRPYGLLYSRPSFPMYPPPQDYPQQPPPQGGYAPPPQQFAQPAYGAPPQPGGYPAPAYGQGQPQHREWQGGLFGCCGCGELASCAADVARAACAAHAQRRASGQRAPRWKRQRRRVAAGREVAA